MEKRWLFGVGIVLLLFSFVLDKLILNFVMNDFIINSMLVITYFGSFYGVFFLGFLIFLYDRKWKNYFRYLIALVGATLVGQVIKYIILRPRPEVPALIIKNTPSFPSSHAVAVFAVYPLLAEKYPNLRYPWLLFAFVVLFSRVFLGTHYPSDVFGGMILGLAIGYLVLYIEKKYN